MQNLANKKNESKSEIVSSSSDVEENASEQW